MRCHSGSGFVSFLADPSEPAAWDDANDVLAGARVTIPIRAPTTAHRRLVGRPLEVGFAGAKDVGLSAVVTCHNGGHRDDADRSCPACWSAAEMLSDTGGVTYGVDVPNLAHSTMVGVDPVPNPVAPDRFLWSTPHDTKGNVPGPCVACLEHVAYGENRRE